MFILRYSFLLKPLTHQWTSVELQQHSFVT